MTGRERVLTALAHREPDRVPLDLGGTVDTGIHKDAYRALADRLGIETGPLSICEHLQQIALVEEKVKNRLAVDTQGVFISSIPGGSELQLHEEARHWTFVDPFGIKWGMPKRRGLYFDILEHPLREIRTPAEIRDWPLPDPAAPEFVNPLAEAVKRAAAGSRAVVLAAPDAGILERALWLRGFKELFTDLLLRPELALSLLDRLTDLHIAYWEALLPLVRGSVQVVVEADDLGTQERLLISPKLYREHIKPRHRRVFETIRRASENEVHIFLHSCGSITEVIPDLVEIGVDALNPVQVSAAGMDTRWLKKEFGNTLTFWGAGVDTQRVLPHGSPQEVRDEVRRRIDDLAPGGGFVFSAVHNIQADVPPENIIAMCEALQECGMYGAGECS